MPFTYSMKISLLLTSLFLLLQFTAGAQTTVPLKFEDKPPKNLYSAPTAVLINYVASEEISDEEVAKIINRYSTQLLTDNQRLNLQMVHFTDKNVLLQPAKKRQLLKQYDSLQIGNLLFFDIMKIGEQHSYIFLVTAYNHTPTLMNPKQRAYTQQAPDYATLVRNFTQAAGYERESYYDKAPARNPLKPALTPEPKPTVTLPSKNDAAPHAFPLVTLTLEDQKRDKGDAFRNYYYYLGADQQERKAGFFGQHLRDDISGSAEAQKELNTYRNYKIAYLLERAIFVGAIIGYMSEVYQERGVEYFNDQQKVYIGIAGGSLLLNYIISRNLNQHMTRAIDEYNAFASTRNQSGFYRLKPSGLGIGAIKTVNPGSAKAVPSLTLRWDLR
jgi:hypothetical protein